MFDIWFVEKNIHGAWVVWGCLGPRQYYGYTKKQAIQEYKAEITSSDPVLRCISCDEKRGGTPCT